MKVWVPSPRAICLSLDYGTLGFWSLGAALPQEELSRDAGGREEKEEEGEEGEACTGHITELAASWGQGQLLDFKHHLPKVTEDTVGRSGEEDKRRVRCLVSSSQWSQLPWELL